MKALLLGEEVRIEKLAQRVGSAETEVRSVVAELEEAGMAIVEGSTIIGAEGVSSRPTSHTVEIDGWVSYTWCAFDTVGIAAAVGVDATARTSCAACGSEIAVVIQNGQPADLPVVGWWPASADGPVNQTFCPTANFFCSNDHLEHWRQSADAPAGEGVALAELAARGRATWGALVAPDGDRPQLQLLSLEGCPNSALARERLDEALARVGLSGTAVTEVQVDTPEAAERLRFRGSPTILVNGQDPFAAADAPFGLTCRVYATSNGFDGAPSVEDLMKALKP